MKEDLIVGQAIEEALRPIATILESLKIPYMLVGALATFLYGEPRATRDLDVAIDVSSISPEKLKKELLARGLNIEGPVDTEFGQKIKVRTRPLPVELFLSGASENQKEEFGRARLVRIAGEEYRIISLNDFALRKLYNLRVRRSQTDVQDILAVLVKQWNFLDFEELRGKCRFYRIHGLLEFYISQARKARIDANLAI